MSRLIFPDNCSCLPRRSILQGLIAAPIAVASSAGQAFPQTALTALEDERFETFRRLVAEEWRLMDIEINAEVDDPELENKRATSWAATDAIRAFMKEVWSTPAETAADVLLRARFMEFIELRYNADNDIQDYYADPARNLVAGVLGFCAANPSFGPLAGLLKSPRVVGVTAQDMAAAIAADSRFARLDDLIAKIVALERREDEAFHEHDAATIASCEAEHAINPSGPCPWVILHNRLCDEIADIARAEANFEPRDLLDLALQNKLADYYFTIGDAGFDETNEICETFARNALLFWGIQPATPVKKLRPPQPAAQERPREASPRQLASEARARIRRAKTQDDLNAITDELMSKFDSFPVGEGYQLQCELLYAHRPDLFSNPSADRAGKILEHLLRSARQHGDWYMEDAYLISQQASVLREA